MKNNETTNNVSVDVKQTDNANVLKTNKSLLDTIKNINVTVYKSNSNTKKEFYKYPEICKSASEKKSLRKKIRNEKTKICISLIEAIQKADKKSIADNVKVFTDFYKKYFLINDFTIESFTSVSETNKPQLKQMYVVCLQYVKDFKVK